MGSSGSMKHKQFRSSANRKNAEQRNRDFKRKHGKKQGSPTKLDPNLEIKNVNFDVIYTIQMQEKKSQEYKKLGNQKYKKGDYDAAVQAYSKAIAIDDCEEALKLDKNNTKAYYIMGIATVEISKVQYSSDMTIKNGISYLDKALTKMEKNKAKPQQIYEVRRKIIFAQQINQLKQQELQKEKSKHLLEFIEQLVNKSKGTQKDKQDRISEFKDLVVQNKEEVIDGPPQWYCCIISLEIMQMPMLTPDGNTYDYQYIHEHLKKSKTDPVSRKYCAPSQLVPNKDLQKAITKFKLHYPWAIEQMNERDYTMIDMNE